MVLQVILWLGLFVIGMLILNRMKKKKKKFNTRVLTGMAIGLIFGFIIQMVYGIDNGVTMQVDTFASLIGDVYIRLLSLMVIPLVFVAMATSIMNIKGDKSITKILPKVFIVLIGTVMIAALVGIFAIYLFGIDATSLVNAADQQLILAKQESLMSAQASLSGMNYSDFILAILPKNVMYMLSGIDSTATLSTVLFGMFVGYATLQVTKRKPEKSRIFVEFMNSLMQIILSMVKEVLKLTPYAVFALMASFMLSNDLFSLAEFGKFLLASYAAIIIMYVIHLIILALIGLKPTKFAKKTWPVLLFGFGSRSSIAALPMNVESQIDSLGVDTETANISATFGTSIGQNGCAGIYPAMVAIMAAQISGVPIDAIFILQLVIVVAISSFGIAGVGGGATYAAIAVLTIMGLDVSIAAILISVEALIDMARTALNVSDGMLAGVVTAKLNKTLDITKYNS